MVVVVYHTTVLGSGCSNYIFPFTRRIHYLVEHPMSFIYLASPYSKYKDGQGEANRLVCNYAAELIKAKLPVFCPISHSHSISVNTDLAAKDHSVWMPLDFAFTEAAFCMVVAMMDGWAESFGVTKELEYMKVHNKPIFYWEKPEEGLPASLIIKLSVLYERHKENVTNKFVPDLHYD